MTSQGSSSSPHKALSQHQPGYQDVSKVEGFRITLFSWGDPSFCSLGYPKLSTVPSTLPKSSQMGPSASDTTETALRTPAWLPSEFHQLLSPWTPLTSKIPGLLAQCCPLALPSREAQFYCKCHTHTFNLSSFFWGWWWWRASPEMFPWNHELQGWVLSHLKNLAMQTSPPVIQSPGLEEQAQQHPATPPTSH